MTADPSTAPRRDNAAEPAAPIRLSRDYLRAVERIEQHPDNQDGTDKSWVWRALKRNRDHFARAIRRK